MPVWPDIAQWRGPSPNVSGGMSEWRGIVLHIAEGSYEGTVSWCLNPSSEISAHFVSAKNGAACQLVDTSVTAWTQAAGNGHWLSIEFEGYAGDSLTAGQIEFAARVLARANAVYGVPLQSTDSVSGRGLGWHGMGGAAWGGHTGCPGGPIVAQRGQIIARAQQIVNGGGNTNMALEGYDRRSADSTLYMLYTTLATDNDNVTSIHVADGSTKTWPNRLKERLLALLEGVSGIRSQLSVVAADVAEIKARPVPSPQLTAEQLAAIGQAAGERAAAITGEQVEALAQRLEELISARVAAANAEAAALT